MQKSLTRKEAGEKIFQIIKAHINSLQRPKGGTYSLTPDNFPPDLPISWATIWKIKRGEFTIKTLEKLDFLNVQEFFTIEEPA